MDHGTSLVPVFREPGKSWSGKMLSIHGTVLLISFQVKKGKMYPLCIPEQKAMEYIQEALQQGYIRPLKSSAASIFFSLWQRRTEACSPVLIIIRCVIWIPVRRSISLIQVTLQLIGVKVSVWCNVPLLDCLCFIFIFMAVVHLQYTDLPM